MIFILALCVAMPVRFGFTPDLRANYGVKVQFDGYLPMLGGKTEKIDIGMTVSVVGAAPDSEGNAQVSSELKEFKLSLNGAAMPFGPKNVSAFFPKNTVSLTAEGRVLKNDAPDRPMPIRLPGLDARRFPEITYLPIEFPAAGIEEGKPYEFSRKFGESDVRYTVTPVSISDKVVRLKVNLRQKYSAFEDAGHNAATEDRAATRIDTDLAGEGTVVFDRVKGLVDHAEIDADAIGDATEIATKKHSERRLHTKLTIDLEVDK